MAGKWPLRAGRFIYGLMLAICGLSFGMLSNSFVGIFLAAMLGAVIGIYLGDKIAQEGKTTYKGVTLGMLIGWGIGLVVVIWQNWPLSAWLTLPMVGALSGGIIGTNVQTAKQFGIQLGLIGSFAGLARGVLYWLGLLSRSGVDGTTLATGLAQLMRSVVIYTLGAGFIGLMVGAVLSWQSIRPRRR